MLRIGPTDKDIILWVSEWRIRWCSPLGEDSRDLNLPAEQILAGTVDSPRRYDASEIVVDSKARYAGSTNSHHEENEDVGMESNSTSQFSEILNSAAQGTSSSRLEIHKHRTGDIPAAGSLIEIDVDALELEVINGGVAAVAALVAAGRINAVLVADNFPELGANLVAALASLNVQDLSHDSLLLLSLPLDSFASMFVGRCNE
nr:hypothetical protein Iba_chr01dCG13670 [Ipomoea batatas]